MKYVAFGVILFVCFSIGFGMGAAMDGFSAKKYSDSYVEVAENYLEMMSYVSCESLYPYMLDRPDDELLRGFVLQTCLNTTI